MKAWLTVSVVQYSVADLSTSTHFFLRVCRLHQRACSTVPSMNRYLGGLLILVLQARVEVAEAQTARRYLPETHGLCSDCRYARARSASQYHAFAGHTIRQWRTVKRAAAMRPSGSGEDAQRRPLDRQRTVSACERSRWSEKQLTACMDQLGQTLY